MTRIFVSYSMNDQPYATEALQKYFGQVDERVEIQDPTFVVPGNDIREAIRERIEASDSFLAVWTKQAPESPWVLYELGMAHALGRPITVLLAGGEPSAIPEEVSEAKVVQLEPVPA